MRRELTAISALSGRERRALLHAWLLLGLTTLAVRRVSLPRLTRWAMGRGRHARRPTLAPARLAELVAVAAAHHPAHPTCLPRALALLRLLRSHGVRGTLRIGVEREGDLAAHAWVEVDAVPLGESARAMDRFAPLAAAGAIQSADEAR